MTVARVSALVTGAGGPIGGAIAMRLLQMGHRVLAVTGRRDAFSLHDDPRDPLVTVSGDVADPDFRQELLERAPSPAVLVNAAGIFGSVGLSTEVDPEMWMTTISVNASAALALSAAILPSMLAAGTGRIVNVSSAQSLYPPDPLVGPYATSKVALNFGTRCLAAECNETNVSVCVVHPGDVKSHMWNYIRDRAESLGPHGAGLREWARRVGVTGGDEPDLAGQLVGDIVRWPAAASNGRFLSISGGGVRHPEPSW